VYKAGRVATLKKTALDIEDTANFPSFSSKSMAYPFPYQPKPSQPRPNPISSLSYPNPLLFHYGRETLSLFQVSKTPSILDHYIA
jgi:hypothetical protein